MNTCIVHVNINVCDLNKSIEFYEKALGLKLAREHRAEDGSFILAYLNDGKSEFELELTWIKDHPQKYNLGENEFHIAFTVKDMQEARKKHDEIGCIVFDNPEMGIYFIADPDGYWLEIMPLNG